MEYWLLCIAVKYFNSEGEEKDEKDNQIVKYGNHNHFVFKRVQLAIR